MIESNRSMLKLKRKKKSVIWTMPLSEFKELVKNCESIGQILKAFNLENKGSNNRTVKARCIEDNVDIEHIKLGLSSNKGRKFYIIKTPLKNILVKNSTFNRTHLKERLIEENMLEYKCEVCGNIGEWGGKKLTLQLEHKNGIHNDNTLQNLCFLCPNCHSQTKTFCGKKNTGG